MKKNSLYTLGTYTLAIGIMNLVFSLVAISIVNLVLFYCKINLFGIKEWCCSYVLGFVILFVLNFDILIKLNNEDK